MTPALEFKDVDILFPGSGRRPAVRLQEALAALGTGASRASIAEKTGVLVGVAAANLTIEQGEICVLMGLSGSGKSTLLRAANGLTPVSRGAVLVRDGTLGLVGQLELAVVGEAELQPMHACARRCRERERDHRDRRRRDCREAAL